MTTRRPIFFQFPSGYSEVPDDERDGIASDIAERLTKVAGRPEAPFGPRAVGTKAPDDGERSVDH